MAIVLLPAAVAFAVADACGTSLPTRLQSASFVICIASVPRRRVVRFAGWSCAILASSPLVLFHCLAANYLVRLWSGDRVYEYMLRIAAQNLFVSVEAFVIGAGVAACLAGRRAWGLLALGTTDLFVLWRWLAFPQEWAPSPSPLEWPFRYFMPY